MGLAVAIAFGTAIAAAIVSIPLSMIGSRARRTADGGVDIKIRSILPALWLLAVAGALSFVAVGLYGAHRIPAQGAILIGVVGLFMASWGGKAWPRKTKD